MLSLIAWLVHWCIEFINLHHRFFWEFVIIHFVIPHPATLTSGVYYSCSRRTSSCLRSTTVIRLEPSNYIYSFLPIRLIVWLFNQILGCKLLEAVSCLFNAVGRTQYIWENELLIINVCWAIYVLVVHYLTILYLLLNWTTPDYVRFIIIMCFL